MSQKTRIDHPGFSGQPATFFQWIQNNKTNKTFLAVTFGGTVLQFVIFKLLYPFPDFFSDSYSYIYAAFAHLDINIWPIGYSKFLAIFHYITHSDIALVAFQYFFLEAAALYLFFTLLYFFQLSKTNKIILFIFLLFNPLNLYLSNYVNSDALFAALSLCWFTQLLWIIRKPAIGQIFFQAILLFLCFTVRNNAYYYPIITLGAFILSKNRPCAKFAGIATPLVLIVPFILYTQNAGYKMTGKPQFSLFTGWQLANNALYIYEYANTAKTFSNPCREVDKLAIHFYGQPKGMWDHYLESNPGNFFIQSGLSPLKQYMYSHYKIADEYSGIVAWGKSSIVFDEFGRYIILHNLSAYFHEFVLLNIKNYFIPHLEKLEVYNLGDDKVWPIARYWFDFKSDKIKVISKNLQGSILWIFPILFMVLNLYLVGYFIFLWVTNNFPKSNKQLSNTLYLAFIFLVANFLFCIATTIIVFRYEFAPMIVILVGSVLISQPTAEIQSEKAISVTQNKYPSYVQGAQ